MDITGRIASGEMEVGGCPLKAGQAMTLSLRAANRDPETYDDPHRFDVSRKHRPHVAFGGGAHTCIGMQFSTLQSKLVLFHLLRSRRWRLDERSSPRRQMVPFPKRLDDLPLVFERL